MWKALRSYPSKLFRFFHISFIEATAERRESYLGIMWRPLATLLFSLMLGFVFHPTSEVSAATYFLYVLTGYVLWNFISSTITLSTSAIQRQLDFAVHNNLSLIGLFLKLLVDRLLYFFMDIALVFLSITLVDPDLFGTALFLLVPTLLVLSLVSIAVAYIVNLTVLMLPDLDPMFNVGVRFMFFVSPVFWGSEGDPTGVRAVLVQYNPAAYFLSAFRQIFGVLPFDAHPWLIALGISVVSCVLGWIAYWRSANFVRNLK